MARFWGSIAEDTKSNFTLHEEHRTLASSIFIAVQICSGEAKRETNFNNAIG
jgi:hypothetical protein